MDAMTPAERERLTNSLSETRRQLLDTVQNLSPAQLDYKPGPDRWSAAQIVEHRLRHTGCVVSWMELVIQESSPASETTDSLGASATSSTGMVVPTM